MSKSLKSHVLAIAKNREAEYIHSLKDKFLDIVKEGVLYRKKKRFELLHFEDCYCIVLGDNKILDSFTKQEFIYIGTLLGFSMYEPNGWGNEWKICVPEHIKGKKMTEAQKMLYEYNVEVKKAIKSEKMRAKKAAHEALEKLNEGDFESYKIIGSDDTYKIKVDLKRDPDLATSIFKNEVKRIFATKGFFNLLIFDNFFAFEIIDKSLYFILYVKVSSKKR